MKQRTKEGKARKEERMTTKIIKEERKESKVEIKNE